jgi:hypothetical protein
VWAVVAISLCIGIATALALRATYWTPSPPIIRSFAAEPHTVIRGQASTLSWSVSGATSITVSDGIGAVVGSSTSIMPAFTTTYTITSANDVGTATAKTTVIVTPPPAAVSVPILLITSASNPFSRYYSEILNAEGFNDFASADISTVTPSKLGKFDIAILGEMPLTATRASMLAGWVKGGGSLVAMRPDVPLAELLGIARVSGTLSDRYARIDTGQPPGTGIVAATIQFHGTADLYALSGARAVAMLYSDAVTPSAYPGVTLREVGAGNAAAFAFDLARSVVYTRQGNPAWAGQNRDGDSLIRPDDLFYPDYLDLTKASIPQADEWQRLLGNLLLLMQSKNNKAPLPRFWYFPRMGKAAIVATGDDHGTEYGTQTIFNKFLAVSPVGCSVADWQCFRATSWIYADTPLSPTAASRFQAQGFDIGSHISTDCKNYASAAQLDSIVAGDLRKFAATFPDLHAQTGNRMHCAVWSDWASVPKVESRHGIRFDMSYYTWPSSWISKAGFMNGSGIPMRYADRDGTAIDVYQQVTDWVNENGQAWWADIEPMIKRALGPEGYYGAFGTHFDYRHDGFPELLLRLARRHHIPIVSAEQMLAWVDGRNASSFGGISWDGASLRFTLTAAPAARGLYAMLPIEGQPLQSITLDATPVTFRTGTIKGVAYAFFPAQSGQYVATYGPVRSGAATPVRLESPSDKNVQ